MAGGLISDHVQLDGEDGIRNLAWLLTISRPLAAAQECTVPGVGRARCGWAQSADGRMIEANCDGADVLWPSCPASRFSFAVSHMALLSSALALIQIGNRCVFRCTLLSNMRLLDYTSQTCIIEWYEAAFAMPHITNRQWEVVSRQLYAA